MHVHLCMCICVYMYMCVCTYIERKVYIFHLIWKHAIYVPSVFNIYHLSYMPFLFSIIYLPCIYSSTYNTIYVFSIFRPSIYHWSISIHIYLIYLSTYTHKHLSSTVCPATGHSSTHTLTPLSSPVWPNPGDSQAKGVEKVEVQGAPSPVLPTTSLKGIWVTKLYVTRKAECLLEFLL